MLYALSLILLGCALLIGVLPEFSSLPNNGQWIVVFGFVFLSVVLSSIALVRKRGKERAFKEREQVNLEEYEKEKLRRSTLSPKQRDAEDAKREKEIKKQAKEKEQAKERARQEARANRYLIPSANPLSNSLICPHCQTKGQVSQRSVTRVAKARLNSIGGVLGMGTNTKTDVTELHCANCGITWDFA